MGRWEPNARHRLSLSALELFVQQGYESTTVAEIAERAGLTKSTFFRHFTDKREVLFGSDELSRLLSDAITGAPDSATPIAAVAAALDATAVVFDPQRRPWAQQRQLVIAGNSELRERELLKGATLAAVMADALHGRGVPDPTASLAAELAGLALRGALARWVDPANAREFTDLAGEELAGLRAASLALD
ncbi:MAG TPA: helix-turn-helix domain-containing protein [Pseudonocardiaceae bacterium]|jgi:AcrR family transcriptional regulator|nr:helix-turn-helix domain-containing protein [Pseudonocardiaceae bacterium]